MSAVPQLPYAGQPSGTHRWLPALSEHILEAYSRIQIRGAAITVEHVIEARRSSNYILQEWSNRGVNLWKVAEEGYPDICIPMQPGVSTYDIPRDTVNLLDSYIRIFTPSATTFNVGIPLVPMVTQNGDPMVTQVFGDPLVEQPGNTLSVQAGSQYVTLRWPAHCLIPGSPIFWLTPISIGGLSVFGFSVVVEVIDWQTVTFMLPTPALETQTNAGQTPLFWTSPQTPLVAVNLPGHGLCQNELFNVAVATTVGSAPAVPPVYLLTDSGQPILDSHGNPIIITPGVPAVPGMSLLGNYPIVFVGNSYTFFINPTGAPIEFLLTDSGQPLLSDNGIPLVADGHGNFAAGAVFENGGQLQVATQQQGRQWTDIFLWPISRNDYAFLPDKEDEGRPTTYWFNRAIYPTITVWPVPPAPQSPSGFKLEPQLLLSDSGQPIIGPNGQPLTTGNVIEVPTFLLPPLAFPQPPSPLGPGPFFAFIGYRMRELEDANPMNGQGLDAPRRFFPVFAAELCAALAEKFKPEAEPLKVAKAIKLWDGASSEDREKLEWAITPDFSGFFN
jgi:hypothetical protein